MWRVVYSVSPRTPEGGQAGKDDKPLPLHILRSRRLPFKEELGTERGKLGNERISKLERDLGRAIGQGRGGGLI
ncbi:phosphinothricin acetyltransferase [Capnocytophaga ochracea]